MLYLCAVRLLIVLWQCAFWLYQCFDYVVIERKEPSVMGIHNMASFSCRLPLQYLTREGLNMCKMCRLWNDIEMCSVFLALIWYHYVWYHSWYRYSDVILVLFYRSYNYSIVCFFSFHIYYYINLCLSYKQCTMNQYSVDIWSILSQYFVWYWIKYCPFRGNNNCRNSLICSLLNQNHPYRYVHIWVIMIHGYRILPYMVVVYAHIWS